MGSKLGTSGLSVYDEKLWGNYRAIVLNNNDPLKLGRIKAEVIPYFVGIDQSIIPWAVPKNPMVEGAGIGIGSSNIPAVGSKVWVFFEMGDAYQPVYDGEASDGVSGLPSDMTTNYPNRKVQKTACGITTVIDNTAKTYKVYTAGGLVFLINDTAKTITLTHPTGAFIEIDPTGQILLNGVNIVVTTTGTTTWTGTGSISIISTGAVSVTGSAVNINP